MKRRYADASDGAKRFGAWMKRARKIRGLTQVDLAILAEVSSASISYMETGHRDPTIGTVLRLADALGYRMVFVDKAELERRKGGTAGVREGGAGTASTRASDAAEAWACGRKDGAGPARRDDEEEDGYAPHRRDDEEEDG